MMLAIVLLVLSLLFFHLGGMLRGLFECVILFDSVDDWLGPKWAFNLFASPKDRNQDGKITFWELNFPNDGGHRAKLYELSCYAIAASTLALSFKYFCISGIWVLVLPLPIWWVISIGFLKTFNKYRKAK